MENNVKTCKTLYIKSDCQEKTDTGTVDNKYASMNSLIAWNISKVLESNPNIDLKSKITSIQERLESKSWDINSMIPDYSEERYLVCAFLAWQKMGQGDASSLYQFIQSNLNRASANKSDGLDIYIVHASNVSCTSEVAIGYKESIYSTGMNSIYSETHSPSGPVLKLPVESKIVMRCDNMSRSKPLVKKPQQPTIPDEPEIDEVCCTSSPCKENLVKMNKSTLELRKRVEQLAKREVDRVKLLTRAEAAWKDLEQGYISRLKLAEEKEEDSSKQIKNLIDERTDYKTAYTALVKQLEEREAIVKKERDTLKKIEQDVCERAQKKYKISEEISRAESKLAQAQCRASHTSRDLLYKEEQARRKVTNLEDSAETHRGLKFETERALRSELGVLKDQVAKVSKRLLLEENEIKSIKTELDELRVNKANILEDLDACKIMCDHLLQDKKVELKTKTEKLAEIKDKVLECCCKLPQDSCVEAKRTPSLAAICRCSSNHNINDSCSCTSLRSTLMSNLLKDLFEGLQSELGENGPIMSCQLLKCLEDNHNWDHSSAVKSNLRSFFEKLLVGELDIAIASSIEKYHAKWVGASCADQTSRKFNNAVENRAQKLAMELADQLFQDKADELIEKAKDVIKSTPPVCECGTTSHTTYPILKTQMDKSNLQKGFRNKVILEDKSTPAYRNNTYKNITQMNVQVLEKKPKVTKKYPLKSTKERNNSKIQRSLAPRNNGSLGETKKAGKIMSINQDIHHRAVSTDKNDILTNTLLNSSKKKGIESSYFDNPKRMNINQNMCSKHPEKKFKRLHQSFAVNLCLNEPEKDQIDRVLLPINIPETPNIGQQVNNTSEFYDSNKVNLSFLSQNTPSIEFSNSIYESLEIPQNSNNTRYELPCTGRDCTCMNKIPSSTSLNKILDAFRHRELKVTDFSFNESFNLINKGTTIKQHQDMFTNTIDECKPIKCESNYMGTIDFDNESFVKSPNILHKSNEKKEDFNGNCKDVVNLCNSENNEIIYHIPDASSKHYIHFKNDKSIGEHERPTHDHLYKCTSTEENQCNTQISVQSFLEKYNQHNLDIAQNDIMDKSKKSKCHVEFLGVTLNDIECNNMNTNFTNKILKNITSRHVLVHSATRCQSEYKSNLMKHNSNNKYNESIVCNNFENITDKNDKLLVDNDDCICCNKEDDEKTDLELNTFELLTEYLQKKLEEFKLSTCKDPGIFPYQEDILYANILKRVKTLILEMNKEVVCNKCFVDKTNCNITASWNRACSLLQEYLRIKVRRITCSCAVTIKNSNQMLPSILDKVCQLIENDFKQLKNAYIDKNDSKTGKLNIKDNENPNNKKNSFSVLSKGITKVISQMIIAVCDSPNSNNTFKGTEKNNLFVEENRIEKQNSNLTNSLTNLITFEEKNNQTVLFLTDDACEGNFFSTNTSDFKNEKNQSTSFSLDNIIDEKFDNSSFPEKCANKDKDDIIDSLRIPYIGCTLDCPCDKILGPCICAKSALLNYKNIPENIWKIRENKNLSYIMHSTINSNLSRPETVECYLGPELNSVCEKEIDTTSDRDKIKLIDSKYNLEKGINNYTNTSRFGVYDDVGYLSYNEWDDCESSCSQNVNEASSNKEKLFESLHLPIDNLSNRFKSSACISDDVLMCGVSPQNCNCEMVPMCHVKMLINNIEHKLENSKCTCDSFNPNVCPIHFDSMSF